MLFKLICNGFFTLRKAVHFVLEVWIFFSVFLLSWTRPLLWAMRLMGREAAAEALAHRLMGRWCRWALRLLRCRVEVEGREHLPARGPYVVMSNHQSNYDPILLVGFLDHGLGFIAKRELFRVPGLGYWLRYQRSLKLKRGDVRGGADALGAYGRELISRQGRVVIFPEGSRTKHPRREIQRFLGGSLILALENGLPVVPVVLDGTRLAGTRAIFVRTPRRERLIRLRIMAPIVPLENSSIERRRLLKEIRERMVTNWEEIRVEWPAVETSPGLEEKAAGEDGVIPIPGTSPSGSAKSPGEG